MGYSLLAESMGIYLAGGHTGRVVGKFNICNNKINLLIKYTTNCDLKLSN